VNVFLIVDLSWVCEFCFIVYQYEWDLWMFSLLFTCMDGIFACFRNRMSMLMESVNILYLSVDMNGICECFTICLFIWMGSVNVFFIVVYMNGIFEWFLLCLFMWMESVNVFFNCYFLWIEIMCMFFIACQNESNLWIFSALFVYMCFGGGDLDIV
jgi:hypothetical protein